MRAVPPVNIVGALFITALEIALFTFGMKRMPLPTTLSPIAVHLVPLPVAPALVPAEAMPTIETAPEPAAVSPPTQQPPPTPEPPSPKPQRGATHRPQQRQPAPTTRPRAEPPAPAAPRTPSPPGGGTMGARALYKPMPEIPEELRHRNINLVAKARFHVARDGSVQVELIQATPLPVLNRALIAALMTWRFFPALENDKPVASTIEINIPIEVK